MSEYLHNEVVESICDGLTEVIKSWTAGDCNWERRKCLKCGKLMETPAKQYRTVHHWAFELEPPQTGPWIAFHKFEDSKLIFQLTDDKDQHARNAEESTGGNISFQYIPVSMAVTASDLLNACREAVLLMCKNNLHLRSAPEFSQAAQILATAICKAEGR